MHFHLCVQTTDTICFSGVTVVSIRFEKDQCKAEDSLEKLGSLQESSQSLHLYITGLHMSKDIESRIFVSTM